MSKLIAFVIAVLAVSSANASAITSGKVITKKLNNSLETELVVAYDGIPWGMAWLPSGDMLITMRGGELLLANKGSSKVEKVAGLPKIARGGQGGLLDIILHPNFHENGWLYFSYSKADGEGNKSTAIMRARLKRSQKGSQLVDKEDIYIAKAYDDKRVHFGSRLAFDHQGYLYFSIGDRGHRDTNPQDISRDAGKVYRLHDDGSIPTDNPFAGKANTKQAIYSFGHRNPQGMATHPKTGAIWTHEHGPRGGDEVNIIAKGKNYGWPVISYGINYSGTRFTDITEKAGMEQPLWYWNPSIAPSGMTFVTSDKYPNWQGNLLVGSLKFGYLTMLTLQDNKVIGEAIVKDKLTRVRNVKQGPDGYIYVAVDGQGILKLHP